MKINAPNVCARARGGSLRALASVAILALPLAAHAALFDFTLTGPGGPFDGTFDAPAAGGPVTALSIVVDGTTYDDLSAFGAGATYYPPSNPFFPNVLGALVFPDGYVAGTDTTALSMEAFGSGWDFASVIVTALPGGGAELDAYLGSRQGNATVGPATSIPSVPEPATLILFGLGLASIGLTRRRREPDSFGAAISPETKIR